MEGLKGCFVCGENHREHNRNSRDEVTTEIEKLKKCHPKTLLILEDLYSVIRMVSVDEGAHEKDDDEEDDMVKWIDEDKEDDSDVQLMTAEDGVILEKSLVDSDFIHERTFKSNMTWTLDSMNNIIQSNNNESPFDGINLETAANRLSVMRKSQY